MNKPSSTPESETNLTETVIAAEGQKEAVISDADQKPANDNETADADTPVIVADKATIQANEVHITETEVEHRRKTRKIHRTETGEHKHKEAQQEAAKDAELAYFLKQINDALLEVEVYSEDLTPSEQESVHRAFGHAIKRIEAIFTPNAKPHDIGFDYRFPKKLEIIQNHVQELWDKLWPGEELADRASTFGARTKGYWSEVKNRWDNDSMPDIEPETLHEDRPAIKKLLDEVKAASIDGRLERVSRRHWMAAAITLAGLGALDATRHFVQWKHVGRTDQLEVADDQANDFKILTVQGRFVQIELPQPNKHVPLHYYVRVSDPSTKFGVMAPYDPGTGTVVVPNSIAPYGGVIEMQIQAMLPDGSSSVVSKMKTVEGVGPAN